MFYSIQGISLTPQVSYVTGLSPQNSIIYLFILQDLSELQGQSVAEQNIIIIGVPVSSWSRVNKSDSLDHAKKATVLRTRFPILITCN